jgi:hypothetical protein
MEGGSIEFENGIPSKGMGSTLMNLPVRAGSTLKVMPRTVVCRVSPL